MAERMTRTHLADAARFEGKVVATLDTVAAFLKDACAEALLPDPHGGPDGYALTSLYFDNAGLEAYLEKIDGVDLRHKVRLRYYGEAFGARPAACFLEGKFRRDQYVSKIRVRVPQDALRAIPADPVLPPLVSRWCVPGQEADAAVLDALLLEDPLQGFVGVRYHRRAFVSRLDPTLRVTVDYNLRALLPDSFLDPAAGAPFLPLHLCVLELKYHWSMPLWLADMIRHFGLQVRRYSKYASAMERIYPHLTLRTVRMQDTLAGAPAP